MTSTDVSDSATPSHSDYAARSRAAQQHILDAAVDVLIECGYAGASTLRIQERADVSRGKLLHHYPHRDALLVAAVQHLAEARIAAVSDLTEWPRDPRARVGAAVDAMWATYHQGYFWAATELWLASRHNHQLAEALAPGEQALGSVIRAATDEMFGAGICAHPHYPVVRDLLNTSMRGVALTYSFDRRDPLSDPHLRTWKDLACREFGLIH